MFKRYHFMYELHYHWELPFFWTTESSAEKPYMKNMENKHVLSIWLQTNRVIKESKTVCAIKENITQLNEFYSFRYFLIYTSTYDLFLTLVHIKFMVLRHIVRKHFSLKDDIMYDMIIIAHSKRERNAHQITTFINKNLFIEFFKFNLMIHSLFGQKQMENNEIFENRV